MSTAQTVDRDVSWLSLKFNDGCYEMVEDGYSNPEPIITLFARGEDMCQHVIRVEGFYPYFCVRMTEALDKHEQLNNDHRVRKIETVEPNGDAIVGNNDERLAKIYTINPKQINGSGYNVRALRDSFEDTWGADIDFVDRFCYDTDLVDSFAIPEHLRGSSDPITVDQIKTDDVDCTVNPRIAYFDIEVAQSDDGPSVVSERGKELADNPVTAISIYDNYTREYTAFVLAHDSWTHEDHAVVGTVDMGLNTDVRIFETEYELLTDFATYMKKNRFDVLTAWNIGFDMPYLVNRYFTLDHMDVFSLSPTRSVSSMNGSGSWINSDIEGLLLFDMLKGFEKASIHELDDSRLETVASEVTDIEKLDIDGIDDAWIDDPSTFVEYSIRDTEAVVEIDNERGILA